MISGLFPSISGCQRVNANGQPYAGATLTVYNGGTLQLSSVFQDIGLAIPGQNPMTLDATGAAPLFYVADGVYRVRLVDVTGVLIYDFPQVASVGASSSGGGGSGVDPTTIFQTGDDLWTEIGGTRTGWVRQNALTIGSATSGASERANADCQPLFLYLWNNYTDAKCPVVGGRGSTAQADWNANKQITLPDKRGKGAVGADGMGNSRAGVLPDSNVTSGGGDTGDTPTAYGGEANHVLVATEMPTHNHGVTDPGHVHGITDPGHNHSVNLNFNDPGHAHTPANGGAFLGTAPSTGGAITAGTQSGPNGATSTNTTGISISVSNNANTTGISINSNTTGISTQNTGGGSQHNNMQPFVIGYWFKKL